MPQGPMSSPLMKPFVVLALPGMYLFYKYNQYKRKRKENAKRRLTERELQHLNNKIEKLLNKLEETEPELATCQEEECVICIHAKATMQTAPCGHQVVCRKCFVKTIQIAVSQRLLPLRCVICRAKILRLKTGPILPSSVSGYSVNSRSSVPPSASLYSVSSTATGSSISSTTSCSSESSCGSNSLKINSKISTNNKTNSCCNGGQCFGGAYPRQPQSGAFRRSQQHAMKMRLLHDYGTQKSAANRLPPIRESSPLHYTASTSQQPPPPPSTRIRCAQKIVTQLENPPQYKKGPKKIHFNYKYSKLAQEDDDIKDLDIRLSDNVKHEIKRKKSWFSSLSLSQNHHNKNITDEKIDNKKNEITEKHQMKMKKLHSFHEFGNLELNNKFHDERL